MKWYTALLHIREKKWRNSHFLVLPIFSVLPQMERGNPVSVSRMNVHLVLSENKNAAKVKSKATKLKDEY